MKTMFPIKSLFLIFLFVIFSCSPKENNNENIDVEEQMEAVDEDDATENSDDDVIEGPMPEETDLIWSDEFDGDALDETKWRYQRGGWNGSNVQNCYVDANTAVSGGVLQITAKYEPGYDCFNVTKDFTSGFVQTKDRIDWTWLF